METNFFSLTRVQHLLLCQDVQQEHPSGDNRFALMGLSGPDPTSPFHRGRRPEEPPGYDDLDDDFDDEFDDDFDLEFDDDGFEDRFEDDEEPPPEEEEETQEDLDTDDVEADDDFDDLPAEDLSEDHLLPDD